MNLKQAVDLAEACGLKTLGEAVTNMVMRAPQICTMATIQDEVQELYDEFEQWNGDTPIDVWVDANGYEWYYKDQEAAMFGVRSLRRII